MSGKAFRLNGLTIGIVDGPEIVSEVDLSVRRGEILAVVGESGSGKTTTALSLLGYCGEGAEIRSGSLEIDGRILPVGRELRALRGKQISYVPQNPGRSLNPTLRVKDAIGDLLDHHLGKASPQRVGELLEAVGLGGVPGVLRRYPHQLSGGQQQRVCIAMALACDPSLIVLDEPTTGLDVGTQDQILSELSRLREERGVSMVYITHDLAVVAGLADRVAVMYAGRVIEEGATAAILGSPQHPYTRGLLMATPDHLEPRGLLPIRGVQPPPTERAAGCAFAKRCDFASPACTDHPIELRSVLVDRQVRCELWPVSFSNAKTEGPTPAHSAADTVENILELHGIGVRYEGSRLAAAQDIDVAIERGTCLALVGESGSGKTTIARAVAGLHPPTAGEILLHGAPLAARVQKRSIEQRRRIQMVFQNSAEALNPRHRIRESIARPAKVLRGLAGGQLDREVDRLLDLVRLPSRAGDLYPSEMSGGEKQRAAIARALAAGPELILCDEVTSALDVSVQAAVLAVLAELRDELGLSLLFITHDFGVVSALAERTVVLKNGVICEQGSTRQLLSSPAHEYTRRLLAQAPSLSQTSF
ncbi:ABC transporter ATP-binding protein [Streptomyces prunicolor]|uniref:ABC transporter ATP-binding protein n=1 Tax=Streptomyces prunicolor TaxID=67348 RepID=UPI0037D406F1